MEAKLAGLIDRLEKVVSRAESSGVQGGASAPAQAASPMGGLVGQWNKDVVSKVAAFQAAANALNIKQVTTASEQFASLVMLQQAVLSVVENYKRPGNVAFMLAKVGEFS